ncbi:MAG: tyrosine recombinase XerC [Clostridia bacterium]|nr:tyrosine recombinase XerC [Clostridia bacterium]
MPRVIDRKQFSPIIQEYANYKIAIQNRSIRTVSEYLFDLRTFFRYLLAEDRGIDPLSDAFEEIDVSVVDVPYLSKIRQDQIMSFLYYTTGDRDNDWAARARKLSAIKDMYKFLVVTKNLIEENPAINIESPKPKRSLPKYLTIEESLQLLGTIRNDEKSPYRMRNYCIVTLFLNCGMRLNELCGINLTDLDPELRSLRVLGKGNKERIVYLNDACQAAIRNYLPSRLDPSTHGAETQKALFLSNRGQRISDKDVQHMVQKYLQAAGLGSKHYSVHKLRHTAATLMYQSGNVDIRTLKDILGHEQLNTTQIYTHVSNEGMARAMDQNPLSHVRIDKHETDPENESSEEQA